MSVMRIPKESLESHVGILGKTGSGKSNVAKVLAEQLMSEGERVCIIDPTGTWWGLRLMPDGKTPSRFTPAIFGGDHGDLSLSEHHGTTLAEAIGTSSTSAIIDTQQMRVGERTRFFTDFAETILRSNRGRLTLIMDEAHIFAPQAGARAGGALPAMLHAANNLLSMGRARGIRVVLISQRPAKVAKDSLTQIETLIAMRLIAPQDIGAIMDWVGDWADKSTGAEIVASLPSLPVGDAWVWAPQSAFLERTHFPIAATFDSGTAEANFKARTLPPIDVEKIGEKMDAIRQEAMANDPARLKARIVELERQKSAPAVSVNAEAIREESYARGVEVGRRGGMEDMAGLLGKMVQDFAASFALATTDFSPPAKPRPPRVSEPVGRVSPPAPETSPPRANAGEITRPMNKIIDSLSMWRTLGQQAPSRAQVALCAGYSPASSNFSNLLSQMSGMGLIAYPIPGAVKLINPGNAVDVAAGRRMLQDRLTGPQMKIIHALLSGKTMTRTDLGEAAGYSPTSSNFSNLLSQLSTLGLITYPNKGAVAIEPWALEILK